MIQEEDSTRTNCIKVFDIHQCKGFPIPFSMTIVDTSSFDAYPEELEMFKVEEIIEIFHEFFENKENVEELDMNCNVRYEICPSFLSVFANDLEENIHCLQPSNYVSKDDIQIFFTLSVNDTKEIRSFFTTGLSMTDDMNTAKKILSNCQNYMQ